MLHLVAAPKGLMGLLNMHDSIHVTFMLLDPSTCSAHNVYHMSLLWHMSVFVGFKS